jgi:hypothetical protein
MTTKAGVATFVALALAQCHGLALAKQEHASHAAKPSDREVVLALTPREEACNAFTQASQTNDV